MPKINIKPLGNNVLIEILSEEDPAKSGTKTKTGIYIPDTVDKEKSDQGIVVAVGPGKEIDGKRASMSVKKGQKVVFSSYGPQEIKVGGLPDSEAGKKYYIINEDNILAIIE